MLKKQIFGVVMAIGLVAAPFAYNILVNCDRVAAGDVAVSREEYDAAVKSVEEMQQKAADNPSQTYKGVDTYLGDLAKRLKGEYDTLSESERKEALAAMNEAVEAVPYLLGLNRQNVSTPTTISRVNRVNAPVAYSAETESAIVDNVESKEVAQVEVKSEVELVKVAETKVENNVAKVDTVVAVAEEVEGETEGGEVVEPADVTEPETAELPNTGVVEDRTNYVGLALAGAAVVAATVAAAVVLLVKKKA